MYKLPVGHAPGSKKNLEPEKDIILDTNSFSDTTSIFADYY